MSDRDEPPTELLASRQSRKGRLMTELDELAALAKILHDPVCGCDDYAPPGDEDQQYEDQARAVLASDWLAERRLVIEADIELVVKTAFEWCKEYGFVQTGFARTVWAAATRLRPDLEPKPEGRS